MKMFKIILILLLILIFDIIFTKSYQLYKLNVLAKNRSMVLNDFYHHELKRNYVGKGSNGEPIFTNEYGFIKLENESEINLENKKNIIFIGDSHTQGSGVAYKDTFAGILTNKLKDEKILINLSAVSYSPSIYFYKTKYFIENHNMKFSDLYVFIDISDPYDELYRYEVKNEKVIDRKDASNPFIDTFYDKIIYNLKNFVTKNTTILYKSLLSIKIFLNKQSAEEKLFFENYGFIINHQANFWTFNDKYFEEEGYKGIELCKKYLKLLKEMVEKNNANLTIAVHPWPGQIYRDDKNNRQSSIWQKWAINNNVNFIDFSKLYFKQKNRTKSEKLDFIDNNFLKRDMHINENMHKIIAKELMKNIN